MNSLIYYFYYLQSKFIGYPLVIRVTVFLTMLLMIVYIISAIRIFIMARKRKKLDKQKEHVRQQYESKFKEILYSERNLSNKEITQDLDIKEEFLKEWEKTYISKLLIDLLNQKDEAK